MRLYLRNIRKSQGLTQQNVAEKLNMTPQYYSLIEKGERQDSLSVSLLCKLAEVFNVPVNQLIEAENKFKKTEGICSE